VLGKEAEEILRRFLKVRRFSKSGERKMHKPLLQLLALSALVNSGSSRILFSEHEAHFQELLREYGPPSDRYKFEYPFRHMTTDGIWRATDSDGGTLSKDSPETRVRTSTGQFESTIERALTADPDLIYLLARAIADEILPSEVADDLLDDLSLTRSDTPVLELDIRRRSRQRNAQWRRDVVAAWRGSCAFCGYDGTLARIPVGIDAAHIRWFNHGGPDSLDNGLALCVLDHRLFDRGALGLSSDLRIKVSPQFTATTDTARRIENLHGVLLNVSRDGAAPHDDFLEWHDKQVFKS